MARKTCHQHRHSTFKAFGLVAACLSAYAISYDNTWNQDLDRVRPVFNKIELELLKRDEFGLEIMFVLVLGICTVLVFVHLVISLKQGDVDDLYRTKSVGRVESSVILLLTY